MAAPSAPTGAARPGRSRTIGTARPAELFVLVVLAQLMASMQFAMVSVAIPDLVRDLDTTLQWASWSISLFTVMQAVSLPLMGRLSDTVGRRTVFVAGISLFALSSLACAVAPNIAVLVAARAVQGISAGSLLPSCYGVVGDVYSGAARARMLGMISSIFPIGAVIGPNLGGFIVDHFGWRWTFMVNVPIAVGVIAWATFRLPGTRRQMSGGRLDYAGAALLTVSVGGLMYALSELGRGAGETSGAVVAAGLAVAVVAGVALAVRETHTDSPLVDLSLLRRREFAFLNALNFLYGVCIFSLSSFAPIYAQTGYGVSASQAGLLLTPRALCMIGMSVVASMLVVRTGFRLPVRVGLCLMATSALLLGGGVGLAERSGLPDLVYLALVVAILGIGVGIAGPSINQAGLDLVPNQVAAITGLRGMFRALGGAVGTAAIATAASRSATEAAGIEHSFLVVGGLALAALVLVGGIPAGPGDGGDVATEVGPTPRATVGTADPEPA